MYKGEILVIGDEYLSLIGVAGGAHAVTYRGECRELVEYLRNNIGRYAIVITYKYIINECRELREVIDESKVFLVELEKPEEVAGVDVKKYYAELARRYLGIEIPI